MHSASLIATKMVSEAAQLSWTVRLSTTALLLELLGGAIAERSMNTPVIVKLFDVVRDQRDGFCAGGPEVAKERRDGASPSIHIRRWASSFSQKWLKKLVDASVCSKRRA
jgi:hypothetical protein